MPNFFLNIILFLGILGFTIQAQIPKISFETSISTITQTGVFIKNATSVKNTNHSLSINLQSEDKPNIVYQLDKTNILENKGKATLTATLSAPTSVDVIIDLIKSGSALDNLDYNLSFYSKGIPKIVAGGNVQGRNSNQLSNPTGLFVDNEGNLFISDASNHRIQKWAPGATSGTTVAGGNGYGVNANQINTPAGIFVDNTQNIFIVDSGNNRIQKWASGANSGTTVAGGNGQGANANQFNGPRGLFIDRLENIYVSDFYNNRIQKWAPGATSGTTVAGGNGYGANANQISGGGFIFIDKYGNIYIPDKYNYRIQKWAPGATSGTTVAGGNGQGLNSNQLFSISTVVLDEAGNIYVNDFVETRAEAKDRIKKWVPGSANSSIVAGGDGTLSMPFGLTIDSQGNLYVADIVSRVQRFQFQPQIVIPAGQTSGTLIIEAIADNINDDSEDLVLETVSVSNAIFTSNKFSINIRESLKISNPPIASDGITITNSNINQGSVVANLGVTDPDGDPLTFSFISGNVGGIFSINSSGQLVLISKPAVFLDPYILTINVSDGTNSKTFTFRVNFCESNFEATATHFNIMKTYLSNDILKGTSRILGSSNVTMEAPKSIELKTGFMADKGTVFKAVIGPGCVN